MSASYWLDKGKTPMTQKLSPADARLVKLVEWLLRNHVRSTSPPMAGLLSKIADEIEEKLDDSTDTETKVIAKAFVSSLRFVVDVEFLHQGAVIKRLEHLIDAASRESDNPENPPSPEG